MNSEKQAVLEMSAGALCISVGAFLSEFPLPGLPEISRFFVHLSISIGIAIIVCGLIIFFVGAVRYADPARLDWLIREWDSMWTSRFLRYFLAFSIPMILMIAFIWNSFAQTKEVKGNIQRVQTQSGCGSTYVGRDNNGVISPDCRTYNLGPERRPDEIYQYGTKIGTLLGNANLNENKTKVIFDLIRFDGVRVDFSQPLEYQGVKIFCGVLEGKITGLGIAALSPRAVECDILGPR